MNQLWGMLALLLFLLAGAIIYERAKLDAPDPYAVCNSKPTEAERRQCENAVDFALSAGW